VPVSSLSKLAGPDSAQNRGSLLQDLKYSIVVDIEQDDFGIRNRLHGFHSPSSSAASSLSLFKDEKTIKPRASTSSASTPSPPSSSSSSSVPMIDYKGQPPWMVSRWKIMKQLEENRRREEMERLMKEESTVEDAVHSLFDVKREKNEDPGTRQTLCMLFSSSSFLFLFLVLVFLFLVLFLFFNCFA